MFDGNGNGNGDDDDGGSRRTAPLTPLSYSVALTVFALFARLISGGTSTISIMIVMSKK